MVPGATPPSRTASSRLGMSLTELIKPKENIQKSKHGPHAEVSIDSLREAIRASLSADLAAGGDDTKKTNEDDDDDYEKDRASRHH
jgi:hypothetical protein